MRAAVAACLAIGYKTWGAQQGIPSTTSRSISPPVNDMQARAES
jgi:hypothetical protein